MMAMWGFFDANQSDVPIIPVPDDFTDIPEELEVEPTTHVQQNTISEGNKCTTKASNTPRVSTPPALPPPPASHGVISTDGGNEEAEIKAEQKHLKIKEATVRFDEEYDVERGDGDLAVSSPTSVHTNHTPEDDSTSTQTPEDDTAAISPKSGKTLFRSFWTSRLDSKSRHSMYTDSEDDDDERGPEKMNLCRCRKRLFCGCGFCHCCYTLTFFCLLLIFPLFLKWMITAPKPRQFWYQNFPDFPLLSNWRFVQDGIARTLSISMSDIPTTPNGCNHSCAGSRLSTSDMNFDVQLKLDAPQLNHNAYPVILASNDFDKWWVAADRRHAFPKQYFSGQSEQSGRSYKYVTEKCNRPPEMASGQRFSPFETFAEAPGYVLACITWRSTKAKLHRGTKIIPGSNISDFCDAIGGTCGWPCSNRASDVSLPGCSADGNFRMDSNRIVALNMSSDSFSGSVSMRACLPGSKECITSSMPLSQWPCVKCHNSTGDNTSLQYDSLPRFEVMMNNVSVDASNWDTTTPQTYILTSPLTSSGPGKLWKKLYDYDIFPLPVPVDELPEPEPVLEFTSPPPPTSDEGRHSMHFAEKNKLRIKPEWCFGKRGALYLVACVVNASTHLDGFVFKPGQEVAPAPFNDRCMALSGRCAYACADEQYPLAHCVEGHIPQADLVGNTEVKTNQTFAVYLFVWILLLCFAFRVVSYLPGVFLPYKHAEFYSPRMTEHLKYVAVVTPSNAETKACVLRNLVGSMSSMPGKCECPFHVVYADEEHRHAHKIMFRAFASIMANVPDVQMNVDRRTKVANLKTRFKEKNLKAFTSQWVELTKSLRLQDCDTEAAVQKIQQLKHQLPQSADKIKKLEDQIDALSGLTALKMMQQNKGWPKAADGQPGSLGSRVRALENAIKQMKVELTCGEKSFGAATWEGQSVDGHDGDAQVPLHLDDHAAYGDVHGPSLYNLHYLARAMPPEDERKLKVQHVAEGAWHYWIPRDADASSKKTWLQLRATAKEFLPGATQSKHKRYLVPIRTCRGKAGGLNFVENYLYDFTCHFEHFDDKESVRLKHALFSISDARHQYQPDFFFETIPHFFRSVDELNPRVAFTQCPQYFQEMPDESDYLDTNNSNFFRLSCILKNGCGGVHSCGTNSTWLIRDRRAGRSGADSMWDLKSKREMDQGFTQILEHRFFHENSKVDGIASSIESTLKGKYSQYTNVRVSYGMSKAPADFLAVIQRCCEGSVVLAWQTFMNCGKASYMIWITLLLLLGFIASIFIAVHSSDTPVLLTFIVGTSWKEITDELATSVFVDLLDEPASTVQEYKDMVAAACAWAISLALGVGMVTLITSISYLLHRCMWCCRQKSAHGSRFPTCLAQWARLLIVVDALTNFLSFWIPFFWIGFNYYSVFALVDFYFEPKGMAMFSWLLASLIWILIVTCSCRGQMFNSAATNEVFILSLTNVWRTTQLFYITAPLTLYSILTGTLDFSRNRTLGEDISYWSGRSRGGRGSNSQAIVRWWTLLLLCGSAFTWVAVWRGWVANNANSVASMLIVNGIGLDALHPCAFLWLGNEKQPLPSPHPVGTGGLVGQIQKICKRCCQLMFCAAFHKNCIRSVVFSPLITSSIKWLGPIQHALLPILTMFYPLLGVHNILLLLAATK